MKASDTLGLICVCGFRGTFACPGTAHAVGLLIAWICGQTSASIRAALPYALEDQLKSRILSCCTAFPAHAVRMGRQSRRRWLSRSNMHVWQAFVP